MSAPRAIPIVALDVPTTEAALMVVSHLGELCRFYKVASELFTASGPQIVEALRTNQCEVFLDLKFHDIPNTVRGAARSAARIGARLISVHATGGRKMLEAAVEGARQGATEGAPPDVFAVTVLTSLDGHGVAEVWGRSSVASVTEEVLRLADLARQSGVSGVVCSGLEAAAIRSRFGDALQLLIPGVRLAGSSVDDQARVVTPADAVKAGARYVVLGRTVTASSAIRDAMRKVIAEIG